MTHPLLVLLACCVLGSVVCADGPEDGWQAARSVKTAGTRDPGSGLGPIQLTAAEGGIPDLPNNEGQVWAEYDLRPFTDRYHQIPEPQQAVVDWILRETGTEIWFSEVPSVLSANRSTLRVYHTPKVQSVVQETVDRFVRPATADFQFGARLITVSSPNWRSRALPRLQAVMVQTPGVEAWLLSREDAAIVLADLKRRSDYREWNSPNLLIPNGQTHEIARRRPLAYVKSVPWKNGYGGTRLEPGQVEEGFSLSISPLLASDGKTVDAVIRLETAQVEKLTPVNVPSGADPTARQTLQIHVPQTSCWRLHERFRWPAENVLLISCGLVAVPDSEGTGLGLPLLGRYPVRADALLFVEAKGVIPEAGNASDSSARANAWNFRGRY